LKRAIFFAIVAFAAMFACASDLHEPMPLAPLDEPYFRCRVQPVLARSCSQLACHGDERRFFRVFARNRLRSDGAESERDAPMRDEERRANFDAARAMLDPGDVERSLLITKPLDGRAGGAFHRGAEIFGGGNVFLSRDEADFMTLRAWTRGEREDPSCVEPSSSQ
jgi:hypothetical protein